MEWIDTCVFTFLPDPVEALTDLSRSVLKNCTRGWFNSVLSWEVWITKLDWDDDIARLEEFEKAKEGQNIYISRVW